MSNPKGYNLVELAKEFAEFQPEKHFLLMDDKSFAHAIANPEPEFIIPFIKKRMDKGCDRKTAIRDLYAFLLDKRYYSHINLLYFAFDVFCSRVALPDEVLEMTPLPHEEGVPLFKYKLSPGYKVE